MMNVWLLVTLALCTLITVNGAKAKPNGTISEKAGDRNGFDPASRCNSTYMIKMEYLQELNDTGSFPEETEKIPMCYVKCFLEAIGVLSNEGKINTEKVVEVYRLDSNETVEECKNTIDAAAVSDDCEKAYFLVRCIMTQSLLDNLGEDNDKV